MRNAFMRTLEQLAEQDPRICLLVGDLGFGLVENFARRFPRQYLNVGVAEQNMTGIAAGMALSGKIVFTYSIANFPTIRCLEQVRNDICYHKADVKIVAVGGGFAYGALGMTHHATEDLAIMRALPNLTVIAPGDPVEVAGAVRAIVACPGPTYLRLGRSGEPAIHKQGFDFRLGKAALVRDGSDLTLIATGSMLATALESSQLLESAGLRARVLSMHTLKPLDIEAVLRAARETSAIVTVEEHSILGGLGGAVAEVLAESRELRVAFKRLGLPSRFASEIGSQEFLRSRCGLHALAVAEYCQTLVANRRAQAGDSDSVRLRAVSAGDD